MATLIQKPTTIQAAGQPPKLIEESVGLVNSKTTAVSIARMKSPFGWSEPGQTPEFDEYTVVFRQSARQVERPRVRRGGRSGDYCRGRVSGCNTARRRRRVPKYIAVCLPAFSPAMVHRDNL